MERKLLIAIGNTGLDKITINYLISLFRDRNDIAFHLFSVVPLSGITESQQLLSDLETVANSNPVALQKRAKFRTCQQNLKRQFQTAGFNDEQTSSEVCFSWGSVSEAIIEQGQAGLYDAVVMGKRDLSMLQQMITGSISCELWTKNHSLPLWIINGTPATRNFLVPVDCSLHTVNAVDHLGFMLQGDPEVEITLFHSCSLLADEHITPQEEFLEKWGKEWCDQHLRGDSDGHYHFHAAEQILKENNIPTAHIHREKNDSGIEPAQVIVREIKKHSYSTIVMGRRLAKDKNIFKGVTDRVLANVHDVALWILN
jgi:nucleotide-binding universal stress UspA family protein